MNRLVQELLRAAEMLDRFATLAEEAGRTEEAKDLRSEAARMRGIASDGEEEE